VKISENSSIGDTGAIPISCLLPSLLLGNESTLPFEGMRSTTVRFTESDLYIIDCLQDRLGLGMIQVIRVAIRRLAEIENILTTHHAKRAKN
jgi:hypothetical protein